MKTGCFVAIIGILLCMAQSCTDPHCTTCKNLDVCTGCKPGYRPVMGRCDACDDPHCSACTQSQNYCTHCEQGYKKEEGRCRACTIQHCSHCPISVSACLQCQKGYHLVNNKCQTKAHLTRTPRLSFA